MHYYINNYRLLNKISFLICTPYYLKIFNSISLVADCRKGFEIYKLLVKDYYPSLRSLYYIVEYYETRHTNSRFN